MKDLPTIHPRKGSSSKYSIWVKNRIFGSTKFNTKQLNEIYPTHLGEITSEQIDRENVFSASYNFEKTYFIKVITPRHLKAHRLFTWWRNKIFKTSKVGKPFKSFETPLEMVKYEYEAATQIADSTNAIADPYKYALLENDNETGTATILYDFVSNAGKINNDSKSLKGFDHIMKSLRELHNGGFVHTTVPNHVIETIPSGEPYLTDPVGNVKPTEKAALHGIGFDIVTLLSVYTPVIGTIPAINAISDYYTDLELVAAHRTAPTVQYCVPGTEPWVVRQIRSSINEYIDPGAIGEYERVMDESRNWNRKEGIIQPSQENPETVSTTEPSSIPLFLQEFVQQVDERENNVNGIKQGSKSVSTENKSTNLDETPLRITKRKTQTTPKNLNQGTNVHKQTDPETPNELHNSNTEVEHCTDTINKFRFRDKISRILSRKKKNDNESDENESITNK